MLIQNGAGVAFISQEAQADRELLKMLPICIQEVLSDLDDSPIYVSSIRGGYVTVCDNPYDCQGCGQGGGCQTRIPLTGLGEAIEDLMEGRHGKYGWLSCGDASKMALQLQDLWLLLQDELIMELRNKFGSQVVYWMG